MPIKRKQAKSKLVTCELCGQSVYARGLSSHMRISHHVVMQKVTKVIHHSSEIKKKNHKLHNDFNENKLTREIDLNKMNRVIEQTVTYKKIEVVPGSRGGKVKGHFHSFMNQLNEHIIAGKNTMFINRNEHPSVDDILRKQRKK